MIMFLFRKERKEQQAAVNEKLAEKIAEKILRIQSGIAGFLNGKMVKLSTMQKKIILLAFCLVFGMLSFWILISAIR